MPKRAPRPLQHGCCSPPSDTSSSVLGQNSSLGGTECSECSVIPAVPPQPPGSFILMKMCKAFGLPQDKIVSRRNAFSGI